MLMVSTRGEDYGVAAAHRPSRLRGPRFFCLSGKVLVLVQTPSMSLDRHLTLLSGVLFYRVATEPPLAEQICGTWVTVETLEPLELLEKVRIFALDVEAGAGFGGEFVVTDQTGGGVGG